LALMLEWIGWALALVLAIGLGYHMRNLRALSRWLEADDGRDPPRMMGAWDRFHALLHRSRREAAKREAELADQVARWRAAARALPDGVVILEGDRIAWCNDTAATHFGIDLAKDTGHAFTHLVRFPEVGSYLEGGDHARPVIVRSAERTFSIQLVPYGVDQSLVLSRDITRFEKLESMRREFVANV